MKLGDLVKYRHVSSEPNRNDFPMTNGLVVGFDSEDDPIVFFTCRKEIFYSVILKPL